MKHILFVITNFRHGGTNKSLENLLSLIDTEKYKVDVFAMEHYGPYNEMLPNCKILAENVWLSSLVSQWKTTKGSLKIYSAIIKLLRKTLSYININFSNFVYKKTVVHLFKNKKYDAVIAFSEGVPTMLLSYLKHDNKISWIHCDYSSYLKINNFPDETLIYKSYKKIVCVSQYTKNKFIELMPFFSGKTISIHNVINSPLIKAHALETVFDEKFILQEFNIISIGRFYSIKRFSFIPEIVKKLIEKGLYFKWFIVGGEGDKSEMDFFDQKIKEFNIDHCLIKLGEKDNPYKYIKNCQLLVSTSLTEACPYVVNEAKILHIPVVCADFGSASEFVEDGLNGLISPIESISEKIEVLIKNNIFYSSIKSNLSNFEYKNDILLKKIENLI